MNRYFHLAFSFNGPGIDVREDIQAKLNRASDWFRYAPNCWIIYSADDADTWYRRLIRIPGIRAHQFFICELNLNNRSGYLDSSAWDWMDQHQRAVQGW